MEGRQERVEPLDRGYDLSSLGGEVEAVARGDRSMQQCPLQCDERAPMTISLTVVAVGQKLYTPPLTGITCPVIPVFAVEDKYTIGRTASSASSSRPIGASEL
jgi:hypothetical protein